MHLNTGVRQPVGKPAKCECTVEPCHLGLRYTGIILHQGWLQYSKPVSELGRIIARLHLFANAVASINMLHQNRPVYETDLMQACHS
jgi:hypothetical protein